MKELEVFRATHLAPFINFYKKHGIPYRDTCARFDLPNVSNLDDGMYLPVLPACQALEAIQLSQHVDDLPVKILEKADINDFGDRVALPILQSATLFQALSKLQYLVKLEETSLTIDLSYHADKCWLRLTSVGQPYNTNTWSNLMMLLAVVRVFTDYQWTPKAMTLSSLDNPSLYLKRRFPSTEITYNPNWVGFSVPRSLLGLVRRDYTELDQVAPVPTELLSMENKVKGLIRAYLSDGAYNLDHIAEIFGVNSRTLQRQLKTTGRSFSQLLDEVQLDKATSLLTQTNKSLLEIAVEVGFSDDAHFIRFFKRMTKITPRRYRLNNNIK